MVPDLGPVRRLVTLFLCGSAFWAGLHLGQSQQVDACRDAGGAWDPRGFCSGERP